MGRPDKGRATAAVTPTIVLVRPQLGENIGMAARAMLNCGLSTLRLVAPRAGSMDALRVGFTTPMDHALALRMIRVVAGGMAVPGNPALRDEEREWLFTPDRPWEAGSHALLVQSVIEDLAGNNVGKPFDVDALESGASSPPMSLVRREFNVR